MKHFSKVRSSQTAVERNAAFTRQKGRDTSEGGAFTVPVMLPRKRSVPFATSSALVLLIAMAVTCAAQGQPTNATGQLTTSSQAISPVEVELRWPRQFEDHGVNVRIFLHHIE